MVTSQVIVPADHSGVHRHPQSILEVRRVLLEQLVELQQFPNNGHVAGRVQTATLSSADSSGSEESQSRWQ
jgi:hypothetical protein